MAHMNSDSSGIKPEDDEHLAPLRTISTVTITSEQFEKLYLNPANKVKGQLRRTFANPTPL